MNNVTLKFPDLASLARFRLNLNVTNLEMNVQQITITCNCSAEQIDDAVRNYHAIVLAYEQAGRQMQS